jgi:hypothetical protein
MSTLNSIFTYGGNYGFNIHSIDSNSFKITWKMYRANLTLILVEQLDPVDASVYERKLDLLFDALVLMYGVDDLINVPSVDKLKREIRPAFKLLDAILEDNVDLFGGHLAEGGLDLVLVNDVSEFQSTLVASCVALNTSYACLMLGGRVVTASTAWWELKSSESHLISLLSLNMSYSTCRDVPIYLPHKNPHVIKFYIR